MTAEAAKRPFQFSLLSLFVVMTIAAFFFARPAIFMACLAAGPAFFFGLLCIRAALVHRAEGWISGLIFGSIFLVFAFGTGMVVLGYTIWDLLGGQAL